jgi:hypothetical protein
MAGAAIPVAEGAAEVIKWGLVAGGVLTGGVVAAKKIKDAKKARDSSKDIPWAVPLTIVRKCPDCPAKDGAIVTKNVAMSSESIDYQAQVTGFAPGTEWHYNGVDFDGFREADCMLMEAKGRYAQFLDENSPTGWVPWFEGGAAALLKQARAQVDAADPMPPVLLTWFFMEVPVMLKLQLEFMADPRLKKIICAHEPPRTR